MGMGDNEHNKRSVITQRFNKFVNESKGSLKDSVFEKEKSVDTTLE
jgi:hypothetical protein